ncbi:MAG: NfeD family protein [Deltaproteobacteria bacterium]|nr:NfeD family protein [Deltaproteobacteria bacterium]MCB9785537.1 NfeD family protein [Deltaproteobacteria bacterium]
MGWIVLVLLIAGAVWYWRRRKRAAALEAHRETVASLSGPNYVGCSATVVSDSLDTRRGRVRVVDPRSGQAHELEARGDEEGVSLARGEEVLVIEGGSGGRPLLVVPNELPRLEDMQ